MINYFQFNLIINLIDTKLKFVCSHSNASQIDNSIMQSIIQSIMESIIQSIMESIIQSIIQLIIQSIILNHDYLTYGHILL